MKRKNDVDVLIYSKWCIECTHPEYLIAINAWANLNDLDVKVVRTAYRPEAHQRATELWAAKMELDIDDKAQNEKAQNYPIFVVYNDVIQIKEFIRMIDQEQCRNKMVKGGKTKNDLQRLPKAKRPKRKNSVDSSTVETPKENR